MAGYVMTPDECRHAYRYPSNRANFPTLESFAEACGVDLAAPSKPFPTPAPTPRPTAQATRPASAKPAPKPQPTEPASMRGEFRRFLARTRDENPTDENPDMTDQTRPTAAAFEALVAKHQTAGKSKGDAIKAAVRENPEAHQAWLQKVNSRG